MRICVICGEVDSFHLVINQSQKYNKYDSNRKHYHG